MKDIPLDPNGSEPGKRTLLGMLAAFALLTVVVVCVSFGAQTMRKDPQAPETPPPVQSTRTNEDRLDPRVAKFLGPLATERRFESWRITRIDPLQFGRLTMEIADETDARFVVDVHARTLDAPPPVANTAQLALYLRTNQRGGETPVGFVKACEALAKALRVREDAGHPPPPLEPLLPR